MSEIRPAFPIGKTQWSKWGDAAREAYNRMIAKGMLFSTAVAEANAVQAAPAVDEPEPEPAPKSTTRKKKDS